MAGSTRRVAAERRALDGLRPATRLAAALEHAGYLLDRATVAVVGAIAADRRSAEGAARSLAPLVEGRLRRERGRLAAASAALGALGPEARSRGGTRLSGGPPTGRSSVIRWTRRRAPCSGCAWRAATSPPGQKPTRVADLVLFGPLVGLVAAAGIGLGMLAASRLDAWDEGPAADGRSAPAEPGHELMGGPARPEDGGETGG